MFKQFVFMIIAVCLSICAQAQAASPNLYAIEASPFDTAAITINGSAAIPCALGTYTNTSPSSNIKCPLDSIVANGTYTIVIQVAKAGSITNTGTGATNTAGGSAVSAPFLYTMNLATVAPPANPKVGP